jgi:hypothetical protein
MKTKNLLRFFKAISFFIFYLPFLDTCFMKECEETIEVAAEATAEIIEEIKELPKDTSNIKVIEAPYNEEVKNSEDSNSNDFFNNEDTLNMYELSIIFCPFLKILKLNI